MPQKKHNSVFFKTTTYTSILPYIVLGISSFQLGTYLFLPFSYIAGIRVDFLAIPIFFSDIIIVFFLFINKTLIASRFKQQWPFWIVITLFLIIHSVLSTYPLLSLFRMVKLYEMVLLFVVFYSIPLSKHKLLLACAFPAAIQLMLAITQFTTQSSLQGVFYFLGERYMSAFSYGIARISFFQRDLIRPYGTFSHPNSMAGYYLLILGYVISSMTKKGAYLKVFIIITSTLIILLSFSKLAIACCVFLLFMQKNNLCLLCRLAKYMSLGVVGLLFISSSGDPYSLAKRIEQIGFTLNTIGQHPLLGVGGGHLIVSQQNYPWLFQGNFIQPVHNIFLLLFVEYGIITTLIALFMLLSFFKKHQSAPLFSLLILIIITGSFDHYWVTLQQNMIIASIFLALASRKV